MTERCEFCEQGKWIGSAEHVPPRCHTPGCPGNPETESQEDPRLLVAIRDAVVAEACRYQGIKKPATDGEYTRIRDIFRYAQAALKAIRKFEGEPRDLGDRDVD